jgi:hypothetical protein
MADETFAIGMAIGVQSAINNPNTTIRDLASGGIR